MTFTEFTREEHPTSGVMWKDFITAIGIWVYVNEAERTLTIAEASMVFNTTPDLVREAVAAHPWLFSQPAADPTQQTIESDGE